MTGYYWYARGHRAGVLASRRRGELRIHVCCMGGSGAREPRCTPARAGCVLRARA